MLERKIYEQMLTWKKNMSDGYALMVEGARRVGKSTIVEEFAKNEYEDYIILNFDRESPQVKELFENYISDLDTFFRNMFILKGKELPKKKSVIVFDEVQSFPPARQSIKYLIEDGRYNYIETGSLIRIKKHVENITIPSEEHTVNMYPMDFEEFLWALGDKSTMNYIREAYEAETPLGQIAHRKIMQQFKTYMAVGGMPQAVNAYVEGMSYQKIDLVKQEIIKLYENDLRKYDSEYREKASLIYKTIPKQLSDHGAHFTFSEIDKNARYKNYIDSVEFVAESMIANLCVNITSPDVFMEAYADNSNFKLYMGDTGLLISMIAANTDDKDAIYKSIVIDSLGANQGIIAENIVAQILVSKNYKLYFHEYKYDPSKTGKEKKYEIDFMIVKNKRVCPIEVKSANYSSHKSFDYFKEKYPIKMRDRLIIHTRDLKREGDILYLPLYMSMCL